MTAEQTAPLTINPSHVGTLELEGLRAPYVYLGDAAFVPSRLALAGTEYSYQRTFPIKGHSAVMPGALAELQSQGRHILVAERHERYYVYVA